MENSKATIQRSLKRKHNLQDNIREKMESYKIIKTRDDGGKVKNKRKTRTTNGKQFEIWQILIQFMNCLNILIKIQRFSEWIKTGLTICHLQEIYFKYKDKERLLVEQQRKTDQH